jgi:hypothetical protein
LLEIDKKKGLSPVAAVEKGPAYKSMYNLHDALSKVKQDATSPIAQIYQNPFLTEGSEWIYPLFRNKEKFNCITKKSFCLNSFELISIDKIALLFSAPAMSLKPFWRTFDCMIDFGRPYIMASTPLYKHCVKWFEDFYIQWDCNQTKKQTIRLELNPNKSGLNYLSMFFSCLKSHALQHARVSRLDIAVDYAMYLNPLCWLCSNTVYSNDWKMNSVTKTRYFGSSESDVQIRVYDKAFELDKKQKIKLDIDLWRIEAQVKKIKGDTFYLLDDEAVISFNPFERLSFYDSYNCGDLGQGAYALFIHCARAYGVDFACSCLDYKTRVKYLSRLKQDMLDIPFNSPADIYKNCFKSVYIRFVNHLSSLFEKGQSLSLNNKK